MLTTSCICLMIIKEMQPISFQYLSLQLFFFMRSELWINYTREIKKRNIPFYLVSLNLNSNSGFILWPFSNIYTKTFRSFEHIFCQNERTASLLSSKGILNHSVTGNTRIDRIKEIAGLDYQNKKIEDFIDGSYCIVAGSVSDKEDTMIFDVMDELKQNNIKWIIAPHAIDKKHLNERINKYPEWITSLSANSMSDQHKVLYIDCIGILSSVYKYANLAIVGGGFSKKGIHNIMEPAVFGVPVIFGPNHRNYDEAIEMITNDFAAIFINDNQLTFNIRKYYQKKDDTSFHHAISNYVSTKAGATDRINASLNIRLETLLS